MNKLIGILIFIIVVIILAAGSLVSLLPTDEKVVPNKIEDLLPTPQQTPVSKAPVRQIDQAELVDNLSIYPELGEQPLEVMYVTVRKGNPSDRTDHSWYDINHSSKASYDPKSEDPFPIAEAIVQVGDEVGPLPGKLGFAESRTNATIQVRGNSSSKRPVKSFKIELRNWTTGWDGQYTIALNKHAGDPTRIKNKLSYDLLIGAPDTISLRTRFVHMYVKDETLNPPSEVFEDYGLFTQVEQPNKSFLRTHGLDPNAQFYKATFFEFFTYPQQLKLVDDPDYDKAKFESVLEVKGSQDHRKLIQMLGDLNDPLIPITTSFENYFDADNYFSWMAFNILVGNLDTSSQNFYLYSPQNSQTWYFIPWDFDGAFSRLSKPQFGGNPPLNWEKGIQTYWGSPFHRKVLSEEKYRNLLDEKIEYWKEQLTEENLNKHISVYQPITLPFIQKMPDLLFSDLNEYDFVISMFHEEIMENYRLYKQSLVEPMPFFVGEPQVNQNFIEFIWDSSYDFNHTDLEYHVQLSRTLDFTDILIDEKVLNFTSLKTNLKLPAGTYFLKITVSNPDGKVQTSFDRYTDINNVIWQGVRSLIVEIDPNNFPTEAVP